MDCQPVKGCHSTIADDALIKDPHFRFRSAPFCKRSASTSGQRPLVSRLVPSPSVSEEPNATRLLREAKLRHPLRTGMAKSGSSWRLGISLPRGVPDGGDVARLHCQNVCGRCLRGLGKEDADRQIR